MCIVGLNLLLTACSLTAAADPTNRFNDPAPPVVTPLPAEYSLPAAAADGAVTIHRSPRPLAPDAIVQDWPNLLGPQQSLVCNEQPLRTSWLEPGAQQALWEAQTGVGFSAPVVLGDRVLIYRRLDDEAVLECRRSEDGARYWRTAHPTTYVDRFRYNGGPRSTPVVSDGRVVTYSPLGRLRCHDLATGHLFWERDIGSSFDVPEAYFGLTTSPVVVDGLVYLNIGGRTGPEMASFDLATGALHWATGDSWGASYATPLAVTVHQRPLLICFLGGAVTSQERPFPGGLLVLDRRNGVELLRHPWRSKQPASVNASSPVLEGEQILVSSLYGPGALAVTLDAELSAHTAYTTTKYSSHWMTPVVYDGILYGFADNNLVAMRWRDGTQLWHAKPKIPVALIAGPHDADAKAQQFGKASLLRTDTGFLCLGEDGLVAWLDLDAEGWRVTSAARLFSAKQTYTPPVISHGLLFVMQNSVDRTSGAGPRLLCYDLRGRDNE